MSKKIVLLALVSLFLASQAISNLSGFTVLAVSNEPQKPLVSVLVNSTIYEAIKPSLDRYAIDVENSGFSVDITETDQLLDNTPEGIRSYLQDMPPRLVGCLLVGDISAAWYEIDAMQFPIDLYYMDLDGIWIDSDNDRLYDEHKGDVTPEIWVGRLKTPSIADEVSLLINYFGKNHWYREGSLPRPWWRALVYIDDRETTPLGTVFRKTESEVRCSLGQIYSDVTFVRDRATTNATDYKHRLEDSLGYQWLYLMCHGTSHNHTFMVPPQEPGASEELWYEWDGTVSSSDYRSINPRVFFYHFFVCSAARYSEPDYLAGSAVFANSYGLLAIGSTGMISTIPVNSFYGCLAEGRCIGTAFREWLAGIIEGQHYPQRCFYSLTIVGDPTLRIYHEVHDVAVTNVVMALGNVTDTETLRVTVTVENQGNFREIFNVTVYYDFFTIFNSTTVSLPPGTKQVVSFLSSQPYRFLRGSHSRHVMQAKVDAIVGELDMNDNTYSLVFRGDIEKRTLGETDSSLVFSIFVNVTFAVVGLVLLRILMLEKIPFLRFLRKYSRTRPK